MQLPWVNVRLNLKPTITDEIQTLFVRFSEAIIDAEKEDHDINPRIRSIISIDEKINEFG